MGTKLWVEEWVQEQEEIHSRTEISHFCKHLVEDFLTKQEKVLYGV